MIQDQMITAMQAHRASLGQNGVRVLTDETSLAGEVFVALEVLTDGASYTADSMTSRGDDSVSLSPSTGHFLFGRFTNVVVTGTVIGYLI